MNHSHQGTTISPHLTRQAEVGGNVDFSGSKGNRHHMPRISCVLALKLELGQGIGGATIDCNASGDDDARCNDGARGDDGAHGDYDAHGDDGARGDNGDTGEDDAK